MGRICDVDMFNKENYEAVVEYFENDTEMKNLYRKFNKIEILNTIQFEICDEFEFVVLKTLLNYDLLNLKKRFVNLSWNITMQ